MLPNAIETDTMNIDGGNNNFSAPATHIAENTPAINALPVFDPALCNSSNLRLAETTMQPQQMVTNVALVPTFMPSVIPVTPLSNAIQSTLVQQISPQQQIMNHVQPVAVPSLPIPLQIEAMQQNLFVQQQHQVQHIQQYQQQQQVQQHLQQVQQQYQQQQFQQQVLPVVAIPQQIPAASQPIIHNLIPEHLQPSLPAKTSMNGTAACSPALILPNNNYVNAVNMMLLAAATSGNNPVAVAATNPALVSQQLQQLHQQQQHQQQQTIGSIPLTVQDLTWNVLPVFNGVNMAYPGIDTLSVDPPLFLVRDFLTHAECDFLIQAADGVWQPAPVVGKGAGKISPSRTSSTCFLAREDLMDYMRKVSALTSKPIDHCELPQVGRYLPSQEYKHHFDAFDLTNEDGRRFAQNGGQRVVTILVYLNDCIQGGQTDFPALNLQVSPRKGSAVVFFPSTVDGYLDKRALHAALPAIDTKYVSQVWIRQTAYNGSPSKRLPKPMVNISY